MAKTKNTVPATKPAPASKTKTSGINPKATVSPSSGNKKGKS